ncbi:MAG TPA: hypothetical protein VH188_02560 [Chthoniobacterales bacterium]|nr:hypothetical protein [Chthoniobacterales bacterium]
MSDGWRDGIPLQVEDGRKVRNQSGQPRCIAWLDLRCELILLFAEQPPTLYNNTRAYFKSSSQRLRLCAIAKERCIRADVSHQTRVAFAHGKKQIDLVCQPNERPKPFVYRRVYTVYIGIPDVENFIDRVSELANPNLLLLEQNVRSQFSGRFARGGFNLLHP